jgi:hypothetical protein
MRFVSHSDETVFYFFPGGGQYDNSYGSSGQYGNFYGGDGQYDNSYGGGQRQYNEYNRGRGGYRGKIITSNEFN